MPSFIPPGDGYTKDGYIAQSNIFDGSERLHDDLEFKYRPASRLDVVALEAQMEIALRNRKIDAECLVKAEKLACQFVADRLLSWSLRDPGGHVVPVSAANVGCVNPALFERLYGIIQDKTPNDIKPPATMPEPTKDEQQKNLQPESGSL